MKKVILLTGASSGIGLATAELLASNGHQLLVTARRESLIQALEERFPDNVRAFKAEVCNVSDVKAAVNACIQEFGRIDVLINNAGIGIFDPLVDGKLEDWHHMVDVNIKGVMNFIHTALPELRKNRGHLINLTSVAAHNVFPNSGMYCSTKHAVLAISEALRLELSSEIKVTSISPGVVNTAFIDQTKNADLLANYKDYFAAGLSPNDIAAQIAFAIDAPDHAVISEIIIRPNKAVK